MIDLNLMLGLLMALAFAVNIIVQLTKGIVPLPTKLWCILVSMTVTLAGMLFAVSMDYTRLGTATIIIALGGSFVVAYVAMYGFDTLKELWNRFKKGENINEK